MCYLLYGRLKPNTMPKTELTLILIKINIYKHADYQYFNNAKK